jgi:uncharacterized repeat protein (TIGR01451 family)
MKSRTLFLVLILALAAGYLPRSASLAHTSPAHPPATLQLSITWAQPAFSASVRTKFEPALLKQLLSADQEMIRAVVLIENQADLSSMQLAGLDRLARRQAVIHRLQSVAEATQHSVRALLQKAQIEGRVDTYTPFWIVNGIAVEARQDVFWELATHPDVAYIHRDHVHRLPVEGAFEQPGAPDDVQAGEVQWNVARVQAEQAWQALGITGAGVVVASMDSGVDWQHPDLMTRYRGYTGKPLATHEGNWYCATNEGYVYPGDGYGHGTHTTGTMVGQNGIGVAPGAQWIAVKVFDNDGLTYDTWLHAGFQWLLAPNGDSTLAPDVVNNSWGSSLSTDQEFLPDIRALQAAGIVPVFSAGNYGPREATVSSPASLPTNLAVGATDGDDQIAHFSSRGPSPWGEIKPEVVAPGVSIVSALPGGGLGIKEGTSMAAPHVAGVIALMLEANLTLTNEAIKAILTETALPLGSGHPNNDYGWGLVNAYAAVARAGDFGRIAGQVTDVRGGAGIPGATVEALSYDRSTAATATTDAQGTYTVSVGPGRFDVSFSAFGYQAQTIGGIAVTRGMTTVLDVGLNAAPVGVLWGSVRETDSDLFLQAIISLPGIPLTTTSSPVNGAYSLILPEGRYTVRAQCSAHRFVTSTVVISSGESTYLDLILEPAPTILVVDSGAWYNDSQIGYYEAALEGLRYVYDRHTIANVGVGSNDIPTITDLLPYDLVLWSAPQDAPGLIGATGAITNYLTAGGRLLLSGQDIAFWDGGGSGYFNTSYLRQYLKAWYVRDDAESRVLDGQGTLFGGMTITIAGPGGADNQLYPDVITVSDPDYAASVWTYQGDGSGGQIIGSCLPYRAVYLSFGLEAVNDDAARREILDHSIDWLMTAPRLAGVELKSESKPYIVRAGEWLTRSVRLRNMSEVSTDTLALELVGDVWPAELLSQPSIELGACQTATLWVSSSVPADSGWQSFDVPTLTARSALSPSVAATVVLTSKTPAPVLLVDGARFYHVEDRYQSALEQAGIAYDYTRVKDVWPYAVPMSETLVMYPMVVWYTAYDWYMPLDEDQESRLVGYLDQGGRLLLSSQDYLFYGHSHALARDYLGVIDYYEDLTTTVALGEPLHPIGWGISPSTLTYPYGNNSDSVIPAPGAQTAFRGQRGYPAALTHAGDGWRTAFSAFPFEAFPPDNRETVLARTVGWLSWLGSSTWQADRRTIATGDQVTMTCVLRNDGWIDLESAHWSATLPAELSLVPGSLADGAVYDPATRRIHWEGGLEKGQEREIRFQARVADSVLGEGYVPFPAEIGYDEHGLVFERPYILRVNAPDLSSSTLSAVPSTIPPSGTLSYVLTMRNTGTHDAQVTMTAAMPSECYATLTGTLESGGIGEGRLISDVLTWTGPVGAGKTVELRYRLLIHRDWDFTLWHQAQIQDQFGESWLLDSLVNVRRDRVYVPMIHRRYQEQVPPPFPTPPPAPTATPLPTPTRPIAAQLGLSRSSP